MAVPNQRTIIIHRVAPKKDDKRPYACIHVDACQAASLDLRGEIFKMWLSLAANSDNYKLELSPKAYETYWGIRKDSYYTAINTLIAKRYIIVDKDTGLYHFYEIPQDSEFQKVLALKDSEKQKVEENVGSEKPNVQSVEMSLVESPYSENQKKVVKSSEKPKIVLNDLFDGFSSENQKGLVSSSENQKTRISSQDSEIQKNSSEKQNGSSEKQKMGYGISSEKPQRNNIYNNNINNNINNITQEFFEELPAITWGDIVFGNLEYETLDKEKGIIKLKDTGELRQLERVDASYF